MQGHVPVLTVRERMIDAAVRLSAKAIASHCGQPHYGWVLQALYEIGAGRESFSKLVRSEFRRLASAA